VPQSKGSLLRALKRNVQRRACATPVRGVYVDNWSWQKGAAYGTNMVDLECREIPRYPTGSVCRVGLELAPGASVD